MPRRTVLHIGTHKTGTTSLQLFLRDEADGLLAAAGACYPPGFVLGTSHSELPLLTIRSERTWPARLRFPELQRPAWLDAARAYVREQIAAAPQPTLVLSHEDLSYVRFDDELDALRELLGDGPVQVVVYLRDPAAFLRSYAAQLEATGFATSDDRDSFAYVGPDSWLVDYDALVDGYRRAFGAGSVDVVDYDAVMRRDGSVIPSFAERLGIPRASLPSARDYFVNRSGSNVRPTEAQLAAIRQRLAEQAP